MNSSREEFTLTSPKVLLRLEAAAALGAAVFVYVWVLPRDLVLFALLFLVPDLALLGYIFNKGRAAAAIYNAVHSYVVPLLLGICAMKLGHVLGERVALIWIAHIAFDRALGFGLKFPGTFKQTHLQNLDAPSVMVPAS